MKRLIIVPVFLILFIACTNAMVKQDVSSNLKLLPLILTRQTDDGKFFIVHRQTRITHIDFKNKDEVKRRKEHIKKNLHIPNYDISDLLDQLFEINKSSVNLNIELDKAKGYIIDSIGKFDAYFKKDGGGWDKLYKDNPKVIGIAFVSVPAYDKENGIILIHRATMRHGRSGTGWISAYKLKDGEIKEIARLMLWIA